MSRPLPKIVSCTPVMAHAGGYSSGDQVGLVNTLTEAVADPSGFFEIKSVVLIDKAKQSLAIDVLFFDSVPTLTSVDNDAFDLADSEMAKCVGHVAIVAGDYSGSASNSVATKLVSGLRGQVATAKSLPKNLYCVLVTRGTPTYASLDLVLKVGVAQL